ncbi:MAG: MBL fold metallo-hydrolase [Woeseiaceae bacterium]|nr:MBL fold metallo-hydrolase [Woeseiaceae bacterium]
MRSLVPMTLVFLAAAADAATVTYIANEGVLVTAGETRVLFDPLFEDHYAMYEAPDAQTRNRIIAGDPPFDDVDAVFVSHHHLDHFSQELMLALLAAQPDLRLYAPAQAVAAMRKSADDEALLARATGIAMDSGDAPMAMQFGALDILVMRVPHSGWPERHAEVENLVFRVTLDDEATVAHFGDAHTDPAFFKPNRSAWQERGTDLAMPPYWFFLSDGGREILESIVQPEQAIGLHVPESIPGDPQARPPEVRGVDLFTRPGESRTIP